MSTLKVNSIVPVGGVASGAGGGVIQTVQTVDATASTAISTTSYTDAGSLNVSSTPTTTSNKILIIATTNIQAFVSAQEVSAGLRILRGSSEIVEYPYAFVLEAGTSGNGRIFYNTNHSAVFLDSPSTTSSTTYKIQLKTYSTSNSMKVTYNQNSSKSTILAMEISA